MSELSTGQVIAGRFRLLGKLGSGGHGEVWRARERHARREIALKILFPAVAAEAGAQASLEREYAISSRLSGPGILQVFAPVVTRDSTVLPMAIAAGGDLRQLRGADFLRTVPLLIELAAALAAAHARGVIHRDLKPGNVLLDAAGHVKLADFGVAAIDGETPRRRLGSPFNSSPQQLAGLPPTPADDVYGFGTLAYELLGGYPPFYPHGDAERIKSMPVPELRPSRPCPIRLITLVMGMLAKRPSDRPTLATVIEGLEESLTDTLPFGADSAGPESVEIGNLAATAPGFPAETVDREALVPVPTRFGRIEAIPAPRWPYGVLVGVILATAATLFTLARLGPAGRDALGAAFVPAATLEPNHLLRLRARFEHRLAELEARGAALWGGRAYAEARSAEVGGSAALEARDLLRAERRWNAGVRDLAEVAMRAPDALAEQLAAGDQALAAGDPARALQAYSVARRIEPTDRRALEGIEHSRAPSATGAGRATGVAGVAGPDVAASAGADEGGTSSAPVAVAGSG